MLKEAAPSTATVAGGDELPPVDIPNFTSEGLSSLASSSSPLQSSPPLESLATMEGRLRTFGRWPVSFLPAEEMAAAGFYFLNWDDAVKCVYCGAVIKDWELGDEAMGEHRRWSPNCAFVNSRQRGFIDTVSYDRCSPSDPPPAQQPRPQPQPAPRVTPELAARLTWPQYRTLEARLATFDDWPSGVPVEPATLSEAGFFYSGTGDRTVCYYCGGMLHNWEPSDDPWKEHELLFPGCWHVLLFKGKKFVRDIDEKRDTLFTARKNAPKTATPILGERSKSQPRFEAPDNRVREMENTTESEHRRWSPDSDFVKSRQRDCVDTVPYDPPSVQQAQLQPMPVPRVTPVHMARLVWPQYLTPEARLATFNDWPSAVPVEPATLSEAGFFYSGTGDCTVCYYCGKRLRDWEPSDDPWLEHELWFPGCWHVLLHKGNDFVREIAENRDALIAAKQNAHRTETTISGEISTSEPRIEAPENRVREMKNTATDDKLLCRICYNKEMGVAFLPCGHIVACIDCASSFVFCPLCREPFQDRARIYLP